MFLEWHLFYLDVQNPTQLSLCSWTVLKKFKRKTNLKENQIISLQFILLQNIII